MKILVTGGCGFIGSNFIHYILKNYPNYKLINLDKLTYAGRLENLKDIEKDPRYKFIKGDICDEKLVDKIFKKESPDVVVHMAAESHVDRSIGEPISFLQTNIFGTYSLLETAKKYKPSRIIYIGTDEEYGSIKKGSFSETDPLNPSSPYSSSKAAASLLSLAYFKTYNLPVIITRSTNNFGAFQMPEKFIPRLLTNAILGKDLPIYGTGKNVRDWIYVDDNCRAIDLVLHKGKIGEIYNIGAGNEKTNIEIAKEIQKRFPDSEIKFVADRPGHDFRYSLNCSKIKKLGFKPKHSFEEALKKTIDWYIKNKWWWQPLKDKSEAIYKNWGKNANRH
jgi:dTDP-glucose 4,6-dehydratase